jgi:glutamine synthetase
MVQNFILPAAVNYQNKLMENVKGLIEVLGAKQGKAAAKAQIDVIQRVSDYANQMKDHADEMRLARKKANKIEDMEKKAIAYCDKVKVHFDEIRYNADKLELLIDDEEWRLPKFREMLFTR